MEERMEERMEFERRRKDGIKDGRAVGVGGVLVNQKTSIIRSISRSIENVQNNHEDSFPRNDRRFCSWPRLLISCVLEFDSHSSWCFPALGGILFVTLCGECGAGGKLWFKL